MTHHDLTGEHLETFVFDPHRASEANVRAMATELLEFRAAQSPPLGYIVLARSLGGEYQPAMEFRHLLDETTAEQMMRRAEAGALPDVECVIGEIREVQP